MAKVREIAYLEQQLTAAGAARLVVDAGVVGAQPGVKRRAIGGYGGLILPLCDSHEQLPISAKGQPRIQYVGIGGHPFTG